MENNNENKNVLTPEQIMEIKKNLSIQIQSGWDNGHIRSISVQLLWGNEVISDSYD